MPVYWLLMSIAAWKGLIQLIHKPFYWEKTQHGMFEGAGETAPNSPSGVPSSGG